MNTVERAIKTERHKKIIKKERARSVGSRNSLLVRALDS